MAALMRGVPRGFRPPTAVVLQGAPLYPPWLRGVGRVMGAGLGAGLGAVMGGGGGHGGGVGGGNWGLFFLRFRCPRALSDIEQGWGSKGDGLLPFTFGRVAENLRRFEYE